MTHRSVSIGREIALYIGATILMMTGVAMAQANMFQLDSDSLQADTSNMAGSGYVVQGGMTTGDTGEVTAPPITIVCGDDILESPENCDGPDLGEATCESLGFASGTLRCTASCIFDKSDCVIASSVGSEPGNGGEGGGGHETSASPVQQGSANTGHGGSPSRTIPATTEEQGTSTPGIPLHPSATSEGSNTHTSEPSIPLIPGTVVEPLPPTLTTVPPAGQALLPSSVASVSPGVGTTESRSSSTTTVEKNASVSSHATLDANPSAPPAVPSAAGAVAIGSMSVTEVGILARLAWIARIKNLYGVIPAFLS